MSTIPFATEHVAWLALLASASGFVSIGALAWRMFECHQDGCHRYGRFRLRHLRLCAEHHPETPDDGRITGEQITQAQAAERTTSHTTLHQRLDHLARDIGSLHAHVAGQSGQAEPDREPPAGG